MKGKNDKKQRKERKEKYIINYLYINNDIIKYKTYKL